VHPYMSEILNTVRQSSPENCLNMKRNFMNSMSPDSFRFLEKLVSAQLQNQDTNFRLAISPNKKLLITIM
jgi:hypothetical protein